MIHQKTFFVYCRVVDYFVNRFMNRVVGGFMNPSMNHTTQIGVM